MSYINVHVSIEKEIELYTQTGETKYDDCVEVIVADGIDERILIRLTEDGEVFFYPDAVEEIGLKSIVM